MKAISTLLQLPTSASSQDHAAPQLRRALALVLDLLLSIILAAIVAGSLQLFWPPEGAVPLFMTSALGFVAALAYFGFATRIFGNSLGKWTFSLQLVGREGSALSASRLLQRLAASVLLPVNALLVLFTRQRDHLGDRWAQTAVVLSERRRNILLSIAWSIAFAVCAVQIGTLTSQLSMLRSSAWTTAKLRLAEEAGAKVPLLPTSFSITNNVAMFHADIGTGLRRVVVVNDHGHWYATDSQPVETHTAETKLTLPPAPHDDQAVRD